jgi:hypothetical protein
MGDDDGFDPFDPALQWLSYPVDTVFWTDNGSNWMLGELHCQGPID